MRGMLISLSVLIVISFIFLINAEEINNSLNNSSSNINQSETNITLKLNETLNEEIINFTNTTIINNTNTELNNTNLTELFNNLTEFNNSLPLFSTGNILENSECYHNSVYTDYNLTINETRIPKQISLNISICYNQTLVYCFDNNNSSVYLYRINSSDSSCNNHGCNHEEVTNPYDARDDASNLGDDIILFICWGEKKQDGYSIWASNGMSLYNQHINIFDFSNSSFISNEYKITNTTIINITNNAINNITNNYSYYYNITNNIRENSTVNLSEIENRLAALEEWRLTVIETLNHLALIINTLEDIIYNKLFVYDFSNSNFIVNRHDVANETIYNITNNITNNINNNITYFYNITNNITTDLSYEQKQEIENIKQRLNVLEEWAVTINSLIDILNEKVIELWDYVNNLMN
jgi:hypothetical protein